MPRRERATDRRATLYTRGALPRPAAARRAAVVEELADVTASGSLDAFEVVRWAKRVPAERESGREGRLVAEFRAWAEAEGARLAPSFDTRRCYSRQSARPRTELVLPVLCLAVREDGELTEVAPRAEDGAVVTVDDCLERLAGANASERRDGEMVAAK